MRPYRSFRPECCQQDHRLKPVLPLSSYTPLQTITLLKNDINTFASIHHTDWLNGLLAESGNRKAGGHFNV